MASKSRKIVTYGRYVRGMSIIRSTVFNRNIDMYVTSRSESTTPRAASLTDNHEIIGNDADM